MSRPPFHLLDVRTWLLKGLETTLLVKLASPGPRDEPKHKEIQLPLEAPSWLNAGDTSWQITAATLVGLMSVPGLAVLYGGVMQKRWSVNSMMLVFVAFCLTLIAWCLWAFKMGFGHAIAHSGSGDFGTHGFLGTFLGKPGSILGHIGEEG